MPSSNRPSLAGLRRALEEMGRDIERVITQGVRGDEPLSATLAYGYLRRAVNVLKATLAVSNAGLGSEVGAQSRVITESGFYLAWILQDAGRDRTLAEREARALDVWDAQIFDEEQRRRLWAQRGYSTPEAAAAALVAINRIRQTRGLGPNERFELRVATLAVQAGGGLAEHYDLAYRTNCLDAHPTLDAIIRAINDDHDFTHERSLFITIMSCLQLAEAAYQLMGRAEEFPPLRERVTNLLGFPVGAFAPGGRNTVVV